MTRYDLSPPLETSTQTVNFVVLGHGAGPSLHFSQRETDGAPRTAAALRTKTDAGSGDGDAELLGRASGQRDTGRSLEEGGKLFLHSRPLFKRPSEEFPEDVYFYPQGFWEVDGIAVFFN